jgi:spermidine synthase
MPSAQNRRAATKHAAPPPALWFQEHLTPFDSYHHGVAHLVASAQTPYQQMHIADIGPYGRALFLDGKLQTATADEPHYHEPIVHTPALLAPKPPARFLVLGGADGGAVREALRWSSATHVTLVDIDCAVVDACRAHLPSIHAGALDDPRVTVVVADALRFIAETTDQFDVVVCDLTDPMENSPSLGLFTVEFFRSLKPLLSSPAATVSLQAGPASLVENRTLFPRICATLRAAFSSVLPFQIFVPTYGSPLGMAVASDARLALPDEAAVDERLEDELAGECAVLDGAAWRGLFGIARNVRAAIDGERRVYSATDTASAYGCGTLQ